VSITFALFIALSLATLAASWSKETGYKLRSRFVIIGFLSIIFGRSMVSEAGYCTAFTDSNFLGFAYVNGPFEKPDFRDDRQYTASLRACAPKRAEQMARLAYGFKLSEDELICIVAKEAVRLSTHGEDWAARQAAYSSSNIGVWRERFWHKLLSFNAPFASRWKGPYPGLWNYYLNGSQINKWHSIVAGDGSAVMEGASLGSSLLGVEFNHCGRIMDFYYWGAAPRDVEQVNSFWRLTRN
jgi:hypothetical protein